MRPEDSDLKYIRDMLDAAQSLADSTSGKTLFDYVRTNWLRHAIKHSIEAVGQAASNVSPGFQNRHPEIPWHAVIATRNVFANEYNDVKHDKVWRIATTHLLAIIPKLQAILPAHPPE